MQELKELQSDTSPDYAAEAVEDNLFEWYFVVRGPVDTEFEVRSWPRVLARVRMHLADPRRACRVACTTAGSCCPQSESPTRCQELPSAGR